MSEASIVYIISSGLHSKSLSQKAYIVIPCLFIVVIRSEPRTSHMFSINIMGHKVGKQGFGNSNKDSCEDGRSMRYHN